MHHVCPVLACLKLVPERKLMCGNHWAMVPRDLARRVYAEYAAAPGSPQHQEACRAAADAVNTAILDNRRRYEAERDLRERGLERAEAHAAQEEEERIEGDAPR